MAVKNLMSSLKPILPQCIQGQLQASASSSKSCILDFDDDVKRWVVIGICLNSVLSPALRKYITPIVDQMYKSLVKQYHIDNQQFQNYLKKYPPTNTMLNYEPINDNKKLYGRHTWKYDYDVKNPVDLSKLFLQTHMAQYVAFDETCDASALLAIVINIDQFHLAVQKDANEIRTEIRNCWAHCNVLQWTPLRFNDSFQLLEKFIKNLHVNATEENRVLGDLHDWKTNGTSFINISVLGAELVGMIQNANATHQESKETTLKCLQLQKELIKIEKKIDELMTNNGKYLMENNSIDSNCCSTDETDLKKLTAYAPCSCHDAHQFDVSLWQEHDSTFFVTDIVNDIMKYLETEHFVVVIGASGMGKSAIIHHIALQICHIGGRNIIPCHSPQEVINHYKKNECSIFVIDDICGKYAVSDVDIENWINNRNKLKMMVEKGKIKILASCRLEIFNEEKVQRSLKPFISYSFDLSSKYKHSPSEKLAIAGKYMNSEDCNNLQDVLGSFAFSPLLCFLFSKYENITRHEFVNEPYNIFRSEWDELKLVDPHKYCLLFMFVISNGIINDALFNEANEDERNKLENVCKSLKIERSTALSAIKDKLDFCVGTYVIKIGKMYKIIHDKMFDFLCYYFGKNEDMISLLIKYANIDVLIERTQLHSSQACHNRYTVVIGCKHKEEYIQRFQKDIQHDSLNIALNNVQMKYQNYRELFLRILKRISKNSIKKIIIKRDEKGNNAFITVCSFGYDEIVLYFLTMGADINGKDTRLSPMTAACGSGNCSTVALLTKKGANLNKADKYGDSPLYVACFEGYENVTRLLINARAKINKATKLGVTPLFAACTAGDACLVKILVEQGADVNYDTKYGNTPLVAACCGGFESIVKILVREGSLVNKTFENEESPLLAACQRGHENIVRFLIEHGAAINYATKSGNTSLNVACCGGYESIVQLLINKNASINTTNKINGSPLYVSCLRGYRNIVQILLENGAKAIYSENNYVPLHAACFRGDYKIAKLLIAKHSEVNTPKGDGQTPLHVAVKSHNEKLVNLLICNGADINITYGCGFTSLYEASIAGNLQAVKILIEKGAFINVASDSGETALFVACREGHYEISEFLVENGADLNKSNCYCNTPLHIASVGRYEKIVKILVKNNADINKSNNYNETPFYIACEKGFYEIAKILMNKEMNIDETTVYGWNAMYAAASAGYTEVVELLLENGATVNEYNTFGWTPLVAACSEGHTDTVILLVNKGADIDIANSKGETPMHFACLGGNCSIFQYLLNKGTVLDRVDVQGNSLLHNACYSGDLTIVSLLLEENVDVNCINFMKNTPLHVACVCGHDEIVQKLMEKHASVKKVNIEAETPLFVACKGGYHQIVRILLEENSLVNVVNIYGWTPIYAACKAGHYETVKILLEKGADLNKANCDGHTPFDIAFINDHNKILRLLQDEGADMFDWPD